MLAVLIGLVFVVAGVWGIIAWSYDFIAVFKGLMPFMLAVGGFLSIVAVARSMSESYEEKNKEPEKSEENTPK